MGVLRNLQWKGFALLHTFAGVDPEIFEKWPNRGAQQAEAKY